MLVPIPGLIHLKYLVPDDPVLPRRHREPVPREISALVRVALDSVFGIRPVTHLHPRRFGAPVRAHITARRKQGLPGVAKLISCHVQVRAGTAEVYGSVAVDGRSTAYAARLDESDGMWRMLSFRVLA